MPLVTYEDVRPWSRAVKDKVVRRQMPPWYANPVTSMRFANDRRLSQDDIDLIVAWVDSGSPRGRDADLPPTPTFADGWSHPDGVPPDRIVAMPVLFEVPKEGQVPIQDFYVEEPFVQDFWAEAVEFRPWDPAVVHHAGVYAVRIRDGASIDEGRLINPPRERASGRQPVFDLDRVKLVGQAGGKGFEQHPPGTAKRISAGRHVHFNLHYQPLGRPRTDRSDVGLWLAKGPVTHAVITNRLRFMTVIANRRELKFSRKQGPDPISNIPPYAEDWPIALVHPILEDITLLALSPHMHLRGRSMTVSVVWPDGREEIVLDVPDFDFNWQLHYQLAEPLRVPAGSKIVSSGRYDNSLRNRYNPAPQKEVYWAEQSWDEMFVPHMEYIIDSPTPRSEPVR